MAGGTVWARIVGALLMLVGAVLLAGGVQLLWLGGSAYYLLAGIACVTSGFLLWRREAAGLWIYAAFLIATVIWALAEVGLQFWQLLPRLAGPAVFGLLLALPFVRKGVAPADGGLTRWGAGGATGVAALALLAGYFASQPSYTERNFAMDAGLAGLAEGEADAWAAYGRTAAGTRFSPASQITPANIADLKPAWTYQTGETSEKMPDVKALISFMSTPLMVKDRLFFCTPCGVAVALDADTGAELWRFDSKADLGDAQMLNCWGVSYHRGSPVEGGQCEERIIGTTIDGRLYAVDAATGRSCPGFGEDGFASLKEGMGDISPMANYVSSPPAIIGNAAVMGGYVRDNFTTGEPSGVIRAFDVVTGRKLWAWDAGRPDDAGPLAEGETYSRGSPNA